MVQWLRLCAFNAESIGSLVEELRSHMPNGIANPPATTRHKKNTPAQSQWNPMALAEVNTEPPWRPLHKPRHVDCSQTTAPAEDGVMVKIIKTRQQHNKMDLNFGVSVAITSEGITSEASLLPGECHYNMDDQSPFTRCQFLEVYSWHLFNFSGEAESSSSLDGTRLAGES